MQIEMCCPACFRMSMAELETAGDEVVERVFDAPPVYALGDGETFEDMICTALADHGPIRCAHCGHTLQISEETLGRLAMSMLARM